MSIEALTYAFKVEGLSPTKKLVLVVLANYADEKGSCYPSYGHIAKIVGLKDSKGVQRIIKEFEQAGILRIEKRFLREGGQTSNRYHLINPTHRGNTAPPPTVVIPPNTKDNTKDNTFDVLFEEFWVAYPRKVNKAQAKKSFTSLAKKNIETAKDLKRLAVNYSAAILRDGTEKAFVLHASTWINNERFTEHTSSAPERQVRSKNSIAG